MKKTLLIILFLIILTENIYSDIKGKILGIDENYNPTPLKNARIISIPSKTGILSDKNGNFNIKNQTIDTIIIVSYIGYKPDTINISTISPEQELTIQLKSNLELETINITGDKTSTVLIFSDGVRTEGISSKGLLKCACCNLSESFAASPSVDVQFSDAITGAKRIQLLGLQSIYSQILSENIPIMRGIAASFGFSLFPGQWLESISIAKGSSVAKNGFESIAGLINIDYKNPLDENPTFLNFYISDMGNLEFNADHTIKINNEIATMLFVHSNGLFIEHDNNKDTFLDKPIGNQINLMNKWNISKEHWTNVTTIHFLTDTRKGGQKGYFTDNNTSLYGMKLINNRYNISTKNGFIFEDHKTSIGTILSFTHHNEKAFFGKRNYQGEQNSFYANIMYQTILFEDSDNITTGISLQYDNYLERLDSLQMNKVENIPGVFIEYTFNQINNLSVIAGIRLDLPNNYKRFISPKLHIKYNLNDNIIWSASVGKGLRVARPIAENINYLSSSREFIIDKDIKPEEAWNYGTNILFSFKLFDIPIDINTEYFHTEFINQLVIDLDKDSKKVYFYNLNGNSYSNSYQIDITIEPIQRFIITAAYRINDVKITTNKILQDKALLSKHKSYINFQYNTNMDEWAFDLTLNYNGKGRIPSTINNPQEYRVSTNFNSYLTINSQITKSFNDFDIYVGCENITGFTQKNPIIAFDKPFSEYFDASLIWGPITKQHIYVGFRYKFS